MSRQCGRASVIVILLVGVSTVVGIWLLRPKPALRPEAAVTLPVVDALVAQFQVYQASIKTQGSVEPYRQIDLVAEVSGRVVSVDDRFVEGAAVNQGDVLLTLDDRDYRYTLSNAESQVATAARELALERGLARQARREWRDLGSAEANALSLRKPQVKAAEAALLAAKAERDRALLDIQRTKIQVPFANGHVVQKGVEIGQFVPVGTVLGTIYDASRAEVRLPLNSQQLNLADFYPGDVIDKTSAPRVLLSADIGGQRHQWLASLERVGSTIDRETRFYHVVASIKEPLNRALHDQALLFGLFVEAEIEGRSFDNVVRLPKKALQGKQLFIVNAQGELNVREVAIIQREHDVVWAKLAMNADEKIVVSDPRVLRAGMKVSINDVSIAADDVVTE